jgi:hypothetical protein
MIKNDIDGNSYLRAPSSLPFLQLLFEGSAFEGPEEYVTNECYKSPRPKSWLHRL